MKTTKRSFVRRVGGVFLSGVLGLMSFGGLAVEAKNVNDNQVVSSTEVSECEKQSEQYYKTKAGKCYHKENCKCLKNSKIEVTDTEIKDTDLKPCKKCCK